MMTFSDNIHLLSSVRLFLCSIHFCDSYFLFADLGGGAQPNHWGGPATEPFLVLACSPLSYAYSQSFFTFKQNIRLRLAQSPTYIRRSPSSGPHMVRYKMVSFSDNYHSSKYCTSCTVHTLKDPPTDKGGKKIPSQRKILIFWINRISFSLLSSQNS